MSEMTTKQVNMNRNPEGKGGFQDHPELRSNGRWSKENSFSYWMNFFKHLTVEEFKNYQTTKPDTTRTVSESLAYARVLKSRDDLKEFQEVANRTEGRYPTTIDITSGGEKIEGSQNLDVILATLESNLKQQKTNGETTK